MRYTVVLHEASVIENEITQLVLFSKECRKKKVLSHRMVRILCNERGFDFNIGLWEQQKVINISTATFFSYMSLILDVTIVVNDRIGQPVMKFDTHALYPRVKEEVLSVGLLLQEWRKENQLTVMNIFNDNLSIDVIYAAEAKKRVLGLTRFLNILKLLNFSIEFETK